jgi:hypothetical protein
MENDSLVRVLRYPNEAEEIRQLFVFMSDMGWELFDVAVMPGNEEIEATFVWPDANVHYAENMQ